MEIIHYQELDKLRKSAIRLGKEVLETDVSYSFRLFDNKQTTELHILYKH